MVFSIISSPLQLIGAADDITVGVGEITHAIGQNNFRYYSPYVFSWY